MSFSPQGKAEVNTKAFCIPRRRLSQMCRVVLVHHMALWCPHTTWHRHVHTLHGTATWNYSAPTQHNQFSSHNNRVRKKNKFYSILRKPSISHSQFDYFIIIFSRSCCMHHSCIVCIALVLSAKRNSRTEIRKTAALTLTQVGLHCQLVAADLAAIRRDVAFLSKNVSIWHDGLDLTNCCLFKVSDEAKSANQCLVLYHFLK